VPSIAAPVRVQVPAKVNLHLGVGQLRPDGFHDVVTVFQAVSIFDRITARAARGLSIEHTGEGAALLPVDRGNLAWRAAEALAMRESVRADVRLEIDKQIPVAGGMAGGSADAAAALLACSMLWHTSTPRTDLTEIAAELGSDVPFPLTGGTALGTGRGEQLSAVLTTGTLHWVFAMADYGISAATAYRELDRLRSEPNAPQPADGVDELLDALRAGDAVRVGAALVNDLQPACLSIAPQLAETLEAGLDRGALGGIVSGSGPTCAFLVPSAGAADDLAAALIRADVCRDARAATGPVHGAKLIPAL
jgi:4-diphosphocytidyl-2-C-methyl-D-erythritol kinase